MAYGSNIFWICIGVLVLAGVYVFCVIAALAIQKSRTTRMRELARRKFLWASFGRLILMRANKHLLAVQVGMFLSALLFGLIVAWAVRQFPVEPWAIELGVAEGLLEFGIGAALIFVLALGVFSFAQTAKGFAYGRFERILCALSLPIIIFARIVSPLLFLLNYSIERCLNLFGINVPHERESAVSAEELNEIIEISTEAGEIEEDEREMIQSVFTFSDTVVREVMTPRQDVIRVDYRASIDEVISVFVAERLSRVLVTGESLDDVKGVLIAKDLMPYVGKEKLEFRLDKVMRRPYFVPNSKKIDDLLQDFKRQAVHFAVVLDEHGGIDGVVTLEDLIEEIVGEIFDEYDSPAEEADVTETKSGDLLVDGSMLLENLNEQHGYSFETGEFDTVAGYVMHHLGRVPESGDILDIAGVRIRVEAMDNNRIRQLRIAELRPEGPKKPKNIGALRSNSFETSNSPTESNQESPPPLKRVGA